MDLTLSVDYCSSLLFSSSTMYSLATRRYIICAQYNPPTYRASQPHHQASQSINAEKIFSAHTETIGKPGD